MVEIEVRKTEMEAKGRTRAVRRTDELKTGELKELKEDAKTQCDMLDAALITEFDKIVAKKERGRSWRKWRTHPRGSTRGVWSPPTSS